MKLYNIHSIRKKAFRITTNSNHNYTVSPNLLKRNFTADKPNQKWVGDITYIPTDEGWLYVSVVKDLCLKKIVGYAFSSRIDTNLTISALEMAINRQKSQDGLIFHSDRGVQYASASYRKAWINTTFHKVCQERVIRMIMPLQKFFSAVSNVNLYIISITEQELKRKLIYFHISRHITIPYGLNRRLIGCLLLHMSTC